MGVSQLVPAHPIVAPRMRIVLSPSRAAATIQPSKTRVVVLE